MVKKNRHTNPLIYMRGMKSVDLIAIIDFLYYGAINVCQENLSLKNKNNRRRMNTDVDTNQPTNMANKEQSPSVSWRNTIYCVQNIDEKYLKTK